MLASFASPILHFQDLFSVCRAESQEKFIALPVSTVTRTVRPRGSGLGSGQSDCRCSLQPNFNCVVYVNVIVGRN